MGRKTWHSQGRAGKSVTESSQNNYQLLHQLQYESTENILPVNTENTTCTVCYEMFSSTVPVVEILLFLQGPPTRWVQCTSMYVMAKCSLTTSTAVTLRFETDEKQNVLQKHRNAAPIPYSIAICRWEQQFWDINTLWDWCEEAQWWMASHKIIHPPFKITP